MFVPFVSSTLVIWPFVWVQNGARLLAAIKLRSSMNCRYQKQSEEKGRGKSSKCVVATRFSSRVCKQRNPRPAGRLSLPHSWCRARAPLYARCSWRARDVIVLIIICTCSAAQVNCTFFTSNAADECECRESRERESFASRAACAKWSGKICCVRTSSVFNSYIMRLLDWIPSRFLQ